MELFEDAMERVRRRYFFCDWRLCRDAGARPSAGQRTQTRASLQSDTSSQAVSLDAPPAEALLAGALL